jgi:DNA-directed RNA polymerase specialized sigma24 family protein
MGAAELTEQVASKDPEVGLAAVAALRRLLTDVERLQVDRARSLGWSWAEIARVLGVTRQSVHEKHRARRKAMGLED